VSHRFELRTVDDEVVVRDVVDGRWAEPAGAPDEVVGLGLWALPGLVDAHAHLSSEELDFAPGDPDGARRRARESLQAGVMLILDKGWSDDTAIDVIRSVPEGDRPDIEAAGAIVTTEGGYMPGFGLETSDEGLEDLVRERARASAGWVKLIGDWPRRGVGPVSNFDEAQLKRAVTVAESEGARVAVHAMAREVPSMAVAAGVHSIEHGLFLDENDLELLGSRQGMWVPTILRCEATVAQLGESSTGGRLLTEGLERIRRLLRPAVEAGVRVLPGTDLIGSPTNVAAEAMKLAEYGLDARMAIEAATSVDVSSAGGPSGFGIGAPANAVLYPANPVDDVSVLGHPAHVIRLGQVR
jgi:imidazolonepropionase-like amidohydrolase